MAYALAQNPAAANGSGAASISKAFASTVTAHSLLVAFITTDAATPGTFTVTGGGTWGSIAAIKEPVSTQWLCIGYCLDATGGTAPTVQASWTGNGTFNGLLIAEFTNGGVASLLDANTAGSTGNNTAPTDSAMTATGADAVVSYAIGTSASPTVGATFTFGTNQDTTDLAAWEYKVLAGAGSVTPVFAITPSQAWGIISAAFKPASVTAVPQTPAWPGRAWWRRFKHRQATAPTPPAADATQPPTGIIAASQGWRRSQTRPASRGRFLPVVPAAGVAAASAWVPPIARARQQQPQPARRRTPPAVPSAQPVPPPYYTGSRRRTPPIRRGRFYGPTPAPVVTTPPAFIPAPLTRRRPPPQTRRGEVWLIPLVGAAPTPPPPFPPPFLEQTHTRPAPVRRGRIWTVPLVGAAPTPPPPVIPPLLTHRPYRPLQRRGRIPPVPPPPAAPPPGLLAARRRPQPGRPRGTRFLPPPYTALPPAPSVWRPPTIRATLRRPARRQARGQYLPLYLLGLPPSTITPVLVGVDGSTGIGGALDGSSSGAGLDGSSAPGGQLDGSSAGAGLDGSSTYAGLLE